MTMQDCGKDTCGYYDDYDACPRREGREIGMGKGDGGVCERDIGRICCNNIGSSCAGRRKAGPRRRKNTGRRRGD